MVLCIFLDLRNPRGYQKEAVEAAGDYRSREARPDRKTVVTALGSSPAMNCAL